MCKEARMEPAAFVPLQWQLAPEPPNWECVCVCVYGRNLKGDKTTWPYEHIRLVKVATPQKKKYSYMLGEMKA